MKKQNSYKKPNWIVYFLYRMISKFIAKFVFNTHINRNELKNVKGPYVVIANHESSIDFINAAALIDRRVHFVISNSFYNTLPIRGLLNRAGVIPKQQFQTSVVDIKKMKQVIDNDMPLVIYPVGLMSENGASDPVPIATSKFLKMMNADVYVCYSKGSYLTKPKWSKVRRKGKIDVYTTVPGVMDPTKWTKINSGDELKVGNWLCIKVTPAEGNTVKSITYANSSQTLVPPAQAGGFYCFAVVPGAQEIGQNYDGSATIPVTAAVTVKKDSGVKSYELGYMVPPAYNDITKVTTEVPVGKWLTVKVEVEDGYVVDKVLVGETELQTYGSPYYCLNVTSGDAIEVNIKTKTESGEAASNATLKAAAATNGSYKVYTCAPYAFGAMTEVTDGAKLVAGNWLCVMPTAAAGYEVANVAHNGSTKLLADLTTAKGFYCFSISEGENNVELFTRTAGATNLLTFAGVQNASVTIKTCAPFGFTAMSTVVDGCELTVGNWICVKITPAVGYEVDTVTHNGSDVKLADLDKTGGFYCFSAAAGSNAIVVTVKASA